MEKKTKEKIKAGAKMAFGAFRVVSGAATSLGIGVVGAFFKSHHMPTVAMNLGRLGIKGGTEMFKEGLEEWDKAK